MKPGHPNEKQEENWRRLLIMLSLVILTAGAVGGSLYYVRNDQANNNRATIDKQKTDIQKQAYNIREIQTVAAATTTITRRALIAADPATWNTYSDEKYKFSFKYPPGIVVTPSPFNGSPGYHYLVFIDRAGKIAANVNKDPDSSGAYILVSTNTLGGSATVVNGLAATYSTLTTPMGFTYYAYEFSKGGQYYYFRMADYGDNKFITLEQFKAMVETFRFN